MPRKKKDTEPAADEMAEPIADIATTDDGTAEPAPVPWPAPPCSSWNWPDSTEPRPCTVAYTEHDKSELAEQMGALIREKNIIEDEKKCMASEYKAKIDKLDGRLGDYAARLKAGGELRSIVCRWIFEVSGRDSDGNWIPHPEYKCLCRCDTGEVIDTRHITEEDRQATLNLEAGLSESECLEKLASAGWDFCIDEEPQEGDPPFYVALRTDAAVTKDVPGDDKLTALRNAVQLCCDAEQTETPSDQ